MQQTRIHALDGLKGISALIIACIYHPATISFCHTEGIAPVSNSVFEWLYQNGGIFVELFFVISGYVSFYVYNHLIDEGLTFGKYVKKRAVRIYPLIFITLALAIVANLVYLQTQGSLFFSFGYDNDTLLSLCFGFLGIPNVLGTQSWNYPAWSMTLFILLWMIYYGVIAFTKRVKNKEVARVLICGIFILYGVDMVVHQNIVLLLYNATIARGFMGFFAGGIVYYVVRYVRQEVQKCICGFALGLFVLFVILKRYGYHAGNLSILAAAIVFPLLLVLILNSKILSSILGNRFFVYAGKISFSIYLLNFPLNILYEIFQEETGFIITGWSYIVIYTAMHIILGSFLYYWAEMKIPAWLKKKRFLIGNEEKEMV